MRGLPRFAGRPLGRLRETLARVVGAARDEPVRWPQVLKAALATGIAWELSLQLLPGKAPPVFAPLAAMLAIQVTAYESLRSAVQRTLGVVAGVLLAYLLGRLLGLHWWSIGLVVLAALALGQALALGTAGSSQVPVSALLVLGLGAATTSYAYTRVLETLLGATVGAVISLVVAPPLHLKDSGHAVRHLAEAQAALLHDIADGLRAGWPGPAAAGRLSQARALDQELRRAQTAVERVGDSIRLNPRARRARPAARLYRDELDALQHVQVQVRGIARTLADEVARSVEIQRVAHRETAGRSGQDTPGSTGTGTGPGARPGPADPATDPELHALDTDPAIGIVPSVPVSGSAAVAAAAAGSALAELRRPDGRTDMSGPIAPPPEALVAAVADLLDLVSEALKAFGAAAVDDAERVGSPEALHHLRQRLAVARRTVRETIRAARAAELAPATWLVIGSIMTDLRRVLAELESNRDVPVNVPVMRSRRIPPRTPRLWSTRRSRARRS